MEMESDHLDFIKTLPDNRRQRDSMWVYIDRVTKFLRFFAFNTIDSVKDYAKIYFNEIVRFHGVPFSIISNGVP